jgi:hypothetical protein
LFFNGSNPAIALRTLADTVRRVIPVRKLLALLLAVVWLPATAHCSLEAVGWHFGHDCVSAEHAGAGTGSDCDDCAVCQSVERGCCASSTRIAVPTSPWTDAAAPDFCIRAVPPIQARDVPTAISPGSGPPCPWQFFLRAAPSPRAPSLIS